MLPPCDLPDPSWQPGQRVRVIRMKPSFTGKDGKIVAGALDETLLTVKEVDPSGKILRLGADIFVKFLGFDPFWGLYDCPKLGQKIVVNY